MFVVTSYRIFVMVIVDSEGKEALISTLKGFV